MIKSLSQKASVALVVAVSTLLVGAGAAGATPPTNLEQIEDMATTAFGEQVLIVLAVATAAATLAGIFFGARLVLRAIRNGGRV